MMSKTHKRKKARRFLGKNMGSHGVGGRKNNRKSGNRGGFGMAGTGKRADHRKGYVEKLYGHDYFGTQGITSRGTKRDKRKRINLMQIESNLENLIKKGIAKKVGEVFEINLKEYKILGEGEAKRKLKIKAFEASGSAIEKVKKSGGEIIILSKKGTI